jgi:hypothetical protein
MQIVSTFHGEFEYATAVAREASNRSENAKRPLRHNSCSRFECQKPRRDKRGHKGRSAPCQDGQCVHKKQRNGRQRQRLRTKRIKSNSRSRCEYRKPRRDERGHKGRSAPCQDSKCVQKQQLNGHQQQRLRTRRFKIEFTMLVLMSHYSDNFMVDLLVSWCCLHVVCLASAALLSRPV